MTFEGITRSIDNYEQYKEDVRKYYYDRYPQKKDKVDEFIGYISKLYDQYQRVYMNHKLMWVLYWKKKWTINTNQHLWIALIGKVGGEGKSSLARHISYFLDPTFRPIQTRVALNYDDFVLNVKQSITETDYPALIMDEPESKTHPMSKKGRDLRDILGKIRQLNLFVCVCGNSVTDFPSFIMHRVRAIFYLNDKHKYHFWIDSADKEKGTIIEDIKKGFSQIGHKIFFDKKILGRRYIFNDTFSNKSPFDNKEYETIKRKDLMKDIDNFIKDEDTKEKFDKFDKQLLRWQEMGQPVSAIAKMTGLSTVYLYEQYKKLEGKGLYKKNGYTKVVDVVEKQPQESKTNNSFLNLFDRKESPYR